MSLCAWVEGQWDRSGIVQWFLHPRGWTPAASEGSVFYKLWALARRGLCRLYELLGLDRLFAGSVFTQTWFWCALPVVLAPLLATAHPSMLVLGLCLVGGCSLLLSLVRDRRRQLVWAPVNRYILLYAAVYLAGTLFSVNPRGSLGPGLLSVAFILFSVALGSAVVNQRQLDALVELAKAARDAVTAWPMPMKTP